MRRVLIGVIASTMLLAVGQAKGDSIAFFNEPNHVRDGAENLRISLTKVILATDSARPFGHPLGDTIDNAWFTALQGASILVIPSLEADLLATLGGTRQRVEEFVSNGGGLIVLGSPMFGTLPVGSDSTQFLNGVFNGTGTSSGFNLKPNRFVSTGQTIRNPLIGAPFNDDPATLPNSDATSLLEPNSLPLGALNIYYDVGPAPNYAVATSSVFGAQYGNGKVAFLGYDWHGTFDWTNYDTPPEDSNLLSLRSWNQVLGSAVEYVRPEEVNVVPEPTTLALWQLGAAGVVLAIRRRRRK